MGILFYFFFKISYLFVLGGGTRLYVGITIFVALVVFVLYFLLSN